MNVSDITSFLHLPGKALQTIDAGPIDGLHYRQKIRRWPILNAAEVDVGFTFSVHYFPNQPQAYTMTVECPKLVWRVSCDPTRTVTNKATNNIIGIQRGRIHGRHFFSWEDNAHMILDSDNVVNHLCYARPLDETLDDFYKISGWLFEMLLIQTPNWAFKPNGLL